MKRLSLHLEKWRRGWSWQKQCWRLHCSTNPAKLKHYLLLHLQGAFFNLLFEIMISFRSTDHLGHVLAEATLPLCYIDFTNFRH